MEFFPSPLLGVRSTAVRGLLQVQNGAAAGGLESPLFLPSRGSESCWVVTCDVGARGSSGQGRWAICWGLGTQTDL